MYARQARKTGGSSTIYSKAFGDHITVDHIITADAKDYGFQGETVAHVVKDVYSKFRYVYPSKTKSGEQCYEDMLHFLGVDDEAKVIYSDNALEFDYAARQLRARHNTSREYVDQNKAVIEHEITTILEGTRANLVQSGLPDRYWPLASQHHALCLNIAKRLDNGQILCDLRYGSKFNGKRIPFRAKVLYWAPKQQKKPERSKFAGTGIEGIFLGYHIQPGFIFNDEYLVAPLHNIANALENQDLRVFRAKRPELPEGGFNFPLATESAVEQPPNLDAQHHNDPPGEDAIATRQGESESASRAALLDDVPFSVKQNLKPGPAAPAQQPPCGYIWSGECLVKKTNRSRPDAIDHSAWKGMSKRQRATAIEEHERKLREKNEAQYREAIKVTPAMPVLNQCNEEHRERLNGLYEKKLLQIVDEMYALVRDFESVASEAKKNNQKVRFGNVFEIGSLKGAELKQGDPNRKYKGRSVFQGNKVLDENADHALFAEMSSRPASMEAGKTLGVFGSQPGYVIQQADAKQAYTQALFQGVATWVRLPRNRWPKEWKGMKVPVVPLKLALYGHLDSAGIWERHCETELKKVRYSMCWGKTLAWIQWQVAERVKELRRDHPECLIDVLAWGCGNEISGQWGCIPTRIAPGLAYRGPSATTEAVAKKVRRSADALAALAGEPDIGFVKVIGLVEASLFQLHSAYDLFNDAMFTEFRTRGLQTQSASPLVEKLEMYDSFHASEDQWNRQLFQNYLHATLSLNLSKQSGWLRKCRRLSMLSLPATGARRLGSSTIQPSTRSS
eukprot:s3183_g10.t3